MDRQIISIYKIPFLTSLTVSIVLLAMGDVSRSFDITLIILGALLGMLALDIEYIIYAYFAEPQKDFSQTVRGFIKHKDFTNLIKYIDYNKGEIKDKAVNSALFQIAFALFAIFALSATMSYFLKAVILSIYANLLYRSLEAYSAKKMDSWFWAFKNKPENQSAVFYLVGVSAIFIYCITLF